MTFIFKGIYPLKVYTSQIILNSDFKQNINHVSYNNKYNRRVNNSKKKTINIKKIKKEKINVQQNKKKKIRKKKKSKTKKIIQKANINIVYNNFDSPFLAFKNNNNTINSKSYFISNSNSNFKFNEEQKNRNIIMYNNKEENKILDNFELNELEYYDAVDLDKRKLCEIYWAILMREHIILFTFFSRNDYNLLYIKFARFIFLVCTDMAMNVFFFSDDSMHKIYLNYGEYDFIQQIPQIIYSATLSQLLEVFLCYLSLTDKHIYQIKSLKGNREVIFNVLRCIKLKLIGFFIFTFILFVFYWYLISAFCSVYQNTQIIFIKDSASSFLTGLLYPFVLYLFPSILRILSLKDKQKKRFKCVYKLSDIIPFF